MSSPLQPQSETLAESYARAVKEGRLQGDEGQKTVVTALERLREELADTPETEPVRTGLLGRLFTSQPPQGKAPKSIYIWGDVGRGKSLLMDMFFASASGKAKRRVHFHAFMMDIHERAHIFRKKQSQENPVAHVAGDLATNYRLVCLDEFQVTDVADAMILHKLFKTQLDKGVTFVITSNRPPEELYKGGLQREKFLAFVELVRERMDILHLDSPQDYRLKQLRAMQTVYFVPRNEENDKALRDSYRRLTNDEPRAPLALEVQGRKLTINETNGGVALFSFHELCEVPLGPADYLAIARRFHVVLVSGIPRLSAEKRNEAKRFVTLIDTLYDQRTKLICTAEASPQELYMQGDGHFEFQRTVSRLVEMQSEGYLGALHKE